MRYIIKNTTIPANVKPPQKIFSEIIIGEILQKHGDFAVRVVIKKLAMSSQRVLKTTKGDITIPYDDVSRLPPILNFNLFLA